MNDLSEPAVGACAPEIEAPSSAAKIISAPGFRSPKGDVAAPNAAPIVCSSRPSRVLIDRLLFLAVLDTLGPPGLTMTAVVRPRSLSVVIDSSAVH